MKCVGHILKACDVLGYNFSFPLVESVFFCPLASPYARQGNVVKTILETSGNGKNALL